jgi:predicted dehydrogenase
MEPTITPSRRDFAVGAATLGLGGLLVGNAQAQPSTSPVTPLAQGAPTQGGAMPLAPPDKQPPDLKIPEVQKKAGWAVVGLGKLALEEILPAFSKSRRSKLVALVSGHPDKARKVGAAYGIQHIYGYANFDNLAQNPDIDIVYVVLPNSMHADYTMRALKAGKHVLCEKPMAATVGEAEKMIQAARAAQRKLMIAYRLHYEPFNQKVMQLCADKTLGPIQTIASSNCQDVKAPNIRLSGELAGGPLGDVGVYSINAARYCTREEPVEVMAVAHTPKDDPRFREVPASVAFTLRFPSGVLAHCDSSFSSGMSRNLRVHCAKGYIELDPAFSYRGLKLVTKQGEDMANTATLADHLIEPVDHFAAEMDHLSAAILDGGEIRTPGEEGLADMKVMAAIEEAIRTGKAAKV